MAYELSRPVQAARVSGSEREPVTEINVDRKAVGVNKS